MNPWKILEIEPTTDLDQIKKAYAKKIKLCKPDVDPQGFQLLRAAYEDALRYDPKAAETKQHTTPSKNENHDLEINNDAKQETLGAAELVFSLLDVLAKSQQEAIDMLLKFNSTGKLDNLVYCDEFQKILAINLLTMTPGYYGFVSYIVDFFNWREQLKNESNDMVFRIARINLINMIRPYQYFQYLNYLTSIKNRKEAKNEKVDWYRCSAAKILSKPVRSIAFLLISVFQTKKSEAIFSLVNEIEMNNLQIKESGLDAASFYWWSNYKNNGHGVKIAFLFAGLIIAFFIIFQYVSEMTAKVNAGKNLFDTVNNATVNSNGGSMASGQEDKITSMPDHDVNVLHKINLNKNIAVLNKMNLRMEDYPGNFMLDSSLLKLDSDTNSSSKKPYDKIKSIVNNSHIPISVIFSKYLSMKINKVNNSPLLKALSDDISLSVEISDYGIVLYEKNGLLSPFISVNAEARQSNTIIWRDSFYVDRNDLPDLKLGFYLLVTNPKYIEKMLNVAADKTAAIILESLCNKLEVDIQRASAS